MLSYIISTTATTIFALERDRKRRIEPQRKLMNFMAILNVTWISFQIQPKLATKKFPVPFASWSSKASNTVKAKYHPCHIAYVFFFPKWIRMVHARCFSAFCMIKQHLSIQIPVCTFADSGGQPWKDVISVSIVLGSSDAHTDPVLSEAVESSVEF